MPRRGRGRGRRQRVMVDAINEFVLGNPPPARGRLGAGARALSTRQRSQVKDIVKNLKEVNHYEYSLAGGSDITSTAHIVDMFVPPQGDGDGERIGDRAEYKSLNARFYIGNVTTGAPLIARVLLVKWKPDTANEPLTSMTQVLESANYQSLPVADREQRRKFNILYDKTKVLYGTGDNGQPNHWLVKHDMKLSGKVHFNEGLTTGSNKIYLIAYANVSTPNTIEWGSGTVFRINYVDV